MEGAMKKMMSLLGMLVAVASASAFPYGSSALEIQIEEYGRFTIEVNGQTYQASNGTLSLEGLMPGDYGITVVRHERRGRGYGAPVHHRVIYQGAVFVPQHTMIQGRLNRYGMNYREVGRALPMAAHCDARPSRGPAVMHDVAFQHLMMSMHRASFDRSKLEIAQMALASNVVTTSQVAVMLREFSFDSYRLELAKVAYGSVVDPQNYFMLTSEFTFDSNARALMRYVSH
jgi:hypothetical protein